MNIMEQGRFQLSSLGLHAVCHILASIMQLVSHSLLCWYDPELILEANTKLDPE